MKLSHARRWLRDLTRRWFGRTAPVSSGRRPVSPILESLEVRMMPTTWIVNSTADPGTGVGSPTYAGSLRYDLANSASGDTITFASSLSGSTITLASASGALTVSHNITITGLGAAKTFISGNNAVELFDVPSGVTASISSLTIEHGSASSGNGGGISDAGTLTMSNVTLLDNTAAIGDGGGIYDSGKLILSNSLLQGNSAGYAGGGIYADIAVMTLTNCTVSANSADTGGGIYDPGGALTVSNSTVENNVAIEDGGGISDSSTALTIANTTISGNSGGLSGGGIADQSGTITLSNSTLSDNTAHFDGGGLFGHSSTLALSNTTFYGNQASDDSGGGIFAGATTVTLSNCTLSANTAHVDGGGIAVSSSTLTLLNTIVAGDSAFSAADGPDIHGTVTLGTYDLLGTSSSGYGYSITSGVTTDTTGVGAGLVSALADNGGTLDTVALLDSSPAIGTAGALTTLTAAVTSTTAVTITFDDGAAIAVTSGDYYILIGSEVMEVTSVSGNSMIVVRGVNGTSATYASGTDVYLATDERGISLASPPDIGAFQLETVTTSTAHLASTATSLTIDGSAFDTTAANDHVSFSNGVTGTVSAATSTTLTVSLTGLNTVSDSTPLDATVTVDGVTGPSSVQVATVDQVTITTAALASGTYDIPYTQTIGVSGGAGSFTFAVSSGSLPGGLSLNTSTGAITGTPTTDTSGDVFTIKVTDTAGSTDSQIYTVAVNDPPVISNVVTTSTSAEAWPFTDVGSLTLEGTSQVSATINVYSSSTGLLGTATANGFGDWSYALSTLTAGAYDFFTTQTVGGNTSVASSDILVTVDQTPPTVNLSVASGTDSVKPAVTITGWDVNGLPNGSPVSLLVYNSTDTTLLSTISGTWVDNGAVVQPTTALTPGTSYVFQGEVTNQAGVTGTSTTVSWSVPTVSSWSLTSAAVLTSDPNTGMALQQLGDVQVSHAVDLSQSPDDCGCGNVDLNYNSDAVSVQPIASVVLQSTNSVSIPYDLTGTMIWDPSGADVVTPFTAYFPGAAPGQAFTLSVQTSEVVTVAGLYEWEIEVTLPGGTVTTTGYVVEAPSGSSSSSTPFGAGFTLSNVDQLYLANGVNISGGIIRSYGTGGSSYYGYSNTSGGVATFSSPASDNGTLTQNTTSGVFTYTTPDGESTSFNSSGLETSWTSADGDETQSYRYTSGKLTGMTGIDGAVTTINYASSTQILIETVNNRTTTLTLSGGSPNMLTSITDPDGGVDSFTYDGDGHVTAETFGDLQNEWAYNSAGAVTTLTSGSSGSPSVTSLSPAVTQGLGTLGVGAGLASETDANGNTTTWQLDSQGRPLVQTDPDHGLTTTTYDNGFVSTVTDPLGRTTTYNYDGDYNVIKTIYADGTSQIYDYATVTLSSGITVELMTESIDQLGAATTYAYDSYGHLTSMTDALGNTTTYTYYSSGADAGLLETTTTPNGAVTTDAYDSDRRLTVITDPDGGKTTYTYDSNGNLATTTISPGGTITYTTTTLYNVMAEETEEIDALGNETQWTYDASGLELTETDARGYETEMVYDSDDRGLVVNVESAVGTAVETITTNVYDPAGQLTETIDADGDPSYSYYDSMGNVTETVDAQGNKTFSTYDQDGELLSSTDAQGITLDYTYNAVGEQTVVTQVINGTAYTATTQYDAAGDVTYSSDYLGRVTTSAYDILGRVTSTTTGNSVLGTTTYAATTTTTYFPDGDVSTVTDGNGDVTSYAYDLDDNVTSTTMAAGTGISTTSTIAYNLLGEATSSTDGLGHTTTSLYNAVGEETESIDAMGNVTTMVYDQDGDETEVIQPGNVTTTSLYDPLDRLTETIDPLGNTTKMVLDGDGNVIDTVDALGNISQNEYNNLGEQTIAVDGDHNITTTQYTPDGQVASVTDADGNITNYFYNSEGWLVETISPTTGTTTQAYDADGEVTQTIDGDGRVTDYSYDNDGRLTGETWYASTSATVASNTQTFTYDKDGNQLTAADVNGTVTNTYNALDELSTTTDVFGNTTTYAYDAAGNQTSETYAAGYTVTSTYNKNNLLTARELTPGMDPVELVTFAYDSRDEMTGMTTYDSTTLTLVQSSTVYGYNNDGDLTAITMKNGSGTTLSYYDYQYDGDDRVTQQSWASTTSTGTLSGTATYGYDAASQLTYDGTTGATYTYDGTGNRTGGSISVGSGNQMTFDGTYTYTYDSAGDLIEKVGAGTTTSYGYDQENQLISINETGTTTLQVTYMYDVLGRRVEQSESINGGAAVVTRYLYDSNGNVLAELSTANAAQVVYLMGNGANQVLGEEQFVSGTWTATYVQTDDEGSVRDVIATSGTVTHVLDHVNYSAFGVITLETSASYGGNLKYTGSFLDAYTVLVYNGQGIGGRFYAAATGTWTSPDDSGFGGGQADFYVYCGNDPTNATDPNGLMSWYISLRDICKRWLKDKGYTDFSAQIEALNAAKKQGVAAEIKQAEKNLEAMGKAIKDNLLQPQAYYIAAVLNILSTFDNGFDIVVPDAKNATTKQWDWSCNEKTTVHITGTDPIKGKLDLPFLPVVKTEIGYEIKDLDVNVDHKENFPNKAATATLKFAFKIDVSLALDFTFPRNFGPWTITAGQDLRGLPPPR